MGTGWSWVTCSLERVQGMVEYQKPFLSERRRTQGAQEPLEVRVLESDHLKPAHSPEAFLTSPGNKLLSIFWPLFLPYRLKQNLPLSSWLFSLLSVCMCVCMSDECMSVCVCVCVHTCLLMLRSKNYVRIAGCPSSRGCWYRNLMDLSHTLWTMSHSTIPKGMHVLCTFSWNCSSPYPTYGKFHDVINVTPMELVANPSKDCIFLRECSFAEKC